MALLGWLLHCPPHLLISGLSGTVPHLLDPLLRHRAREPVSREASGALKPRPRLEELMRPLPCWKMSAGRSRFNTSVSTGAALGQADGARHGSRRRGKLHLRRSIRVLNRIGLEDLFPGTLLRATKAATARL